MVTSLLVTMGFDPPVGDPPVGKTKSGAGEVFFLCMVASYLVTMALI
jgi:hypothetical protein